MNDKVGMVAAFFGGASIGAALGILFAPEKGSVTRERICEALSKKGVNLSKENLERVVDKVMEELNIKDIEVEAGIKAETTA